MNAVSHCNRPRASSSAMKVRQRRSHVPSSSHRRRRRQQGEGLGYSLGRSRHRAPVLSTQRMPSTTARWVTQGRPPRRLRGKRGSSGSILAHCASVRWTLRLATRATSGQCINAAREKLASTKCWTLAGYETGSSQNGIDRLRFAARGLRCELEHCTTQSHMRREPVMSKVRWIGLDVHAETIAVAVAESGGEVRALRVIPNQAASSAAFGARG